MHHPMQPAIDSIEAAKANVRFAIGRATAYAEQREYSILLDRLHEAHADLVTLGNQALRLKARHDMTQAA